METIRFHACFNVKSWYPPTNRFINDHKFPHTAWWEGQFKFPVKYGEKNSLAKISEIILGSAVNVRHIAQPQRFDWRSSNFFCYEYRSEKIRRLLRELINQGLFLNLVMDMVTSYLWVSSISLTQIFIVASCHTYLPF